MKRFPDLSEVEPGVSPAEVISRHPHLAYLFEEGPRFPWLGVVADVVHRSS